jgi:hypothetical protein
MAGSVTASWKKVAEGDVLKRSSHAVAAIDGQAYVFGGELVARQPRDGDVHAVALGGGMFERLPVFHDRTGHANMTRLTIFTTNLDLLL